MSAAVERPRLHLVDGTSQLYRAYFALPPMNNGAGLPTHAVYGFTTMLRKLLREQRPTHAVVVFDAPGEVFRSAAFAEYKANRQPTPDDLQRQMPWARRVTEALGIPVIEQPGFEADDLIATWTARARDGGFDVVVVASDKDLLQLVGDGVVVYHPSREAFLDPAGVAASFGVPPERVLDAQGLMGDSVDNIPGVPGVGEKTAVALVGAYGDLESVIERAGCFVELDAARDALLATLERGAPVPMAELERLSACLDALSRVERDAEYRERLRALAVFVGEARGRPESASPRALRRELKALDRGSSRRIWQAIHEHRDAARLSKRLARLQPDVPVAGDVEQFRVASANRELLRGLFHELAFRSLQAELEREPEPEGAAPRVSAVREPAPSEIVITPEALRALASGLREAGRVGVAVRAEGPNALQARLVGIALSDGRGRSAYVPVGHAYLGVPDQLGRAVLGEILGPLLADAGLRRFGHDVKSQSHTLRRAGFPVAGWTFDTRVGWFVLDSSRASYPLAPLVAELLGQELPATDEAAGARRRPLPETPIESVGPRAAAEAAVLVPLAEALEARLVASGLEAVYRTLDGPLLPVLERMEANGVGIDTTLLAELSREFDATLATLRGEIQQLAGGPFNPDSPKQLREVLFDRLGLESRRKTAKSRVASTDAETLEELAREHAIARKLLEYRELSKLKGTYVDALPRLVHPETGRVHTSFDPTGAATGRLSSSDPNLQNIPVRTAAGRRIRAAFVAPPGWLLLSSDYSQIELRVLAHLCGDEQLRAAFANDDDIHRFTAARIFGVPLEAVTSDMRRAAKVVNFGVLYGMSEARLAREQGIARADARRFIEAYFDRFAAVRGYIERVREAALREGQVRTLFGRVRRFPQLARGGGHRGEQEQALRAAVNATIQGTAADLMKAAMLRVDAELAAERLGARILLQVHDELLLEVPQEQLERTRVVVRREMESVCQLDVPLRVDQRVGPNWLEVA